MKTQIKRFSKSTLAVVLTLCMLVSCVTAGIIATDAAKVSENSAVAANVKDTEAVEAKISDSDPAVAAKADSETVGAETYYLHYGTDASKNPSNTTRVTMTDAGNDTYTASFTAGSSNYYFGINQSTTAGSSFTSSTSFTSTTTNWGQIEDGYSNYWATSWASNGSTVYVTYNSSTGAVTASSSSSSSSTTVYVYGVNFTSGSNAWNWGGDNTKLSKMTEGSTAGQYYLEHTVTSGDEFAFFDGTTHYRSNGTNNYLKTDGTKSDISKGWDNATFYLSNFTAGSKVNIWFDMTNEQVWAEYAETKHDVVFSAGTGGTISPSGTVSVGESTATTVTATANAGYAFSSWTNGTGITQKTNTSSGDNQTQTITTKTSGNYTVQANFAKKNLTVSKGTHTGGDFTLSKTTAQIGDTITISGITPNKGYKLATSNPVKYTYNGTTSNATKSGDNYTFTMPGYNTTVSVSFTGLTGNITKSGSPSAGLDTFYIANSATATNNYSSYTVGSTSRYARVKAKDAYTFDKFVITYGDGSTVTVNAASATYNSSTKFYTTQLNTDGSKFSGTSGDIDVVAYFTKKPTHKVTVVSNNNALGTATASVTEAYEGQQVTLIPKEDTGSFSSWSVTSGGVSVSNNKFTMGSSDVSISATFVAYSGTSNFYYNSYGDDGQPASSRYGARMTEAKIGGQTYSYYHVTGRTESDQLFTVSYESPKYDSYNCFFEIGDSWDGDPQVLFYATDGKNLGDWATMNWVDWTTGHKKFSYPIPDGARSVRFKHGDTETAELFFTSGNNGWYTNGNLSSLTGYSQSTPVETNFWENFNSTKYTDAFESKGFYGHNANRGESHAYTKPKDLGAYSSDYYVLVLYKGKTYTINGVTKTITEDPEIIWLPELPDSGDTIKVYAKDGAIRGSSLTYADIADTTVLKADGTTSADATKYTSTGNQTYEVYKAQRGETITIKTTIGLDKDGNALTSPTAASLRLKYYVRGFMVNGEVPKGTLITIPDTTDGVYTLTYTVPEDFEGKYIEITPVYYLVNTTTYPVVTFRATDFPKNQYNWGDTPYVYPFYGKLGGHNNAFGAYAGQPMIFYNGQYSIQIPQKSTAWAYDNNSNNNIGAADLAAVNNTTVSGVTMSNGYYDTIHKLIMGYGDNSTSADHVQTYDYGDFYKIFNEKKPVDNIVFDFKYRTAKHNLTDIITTNTTASDLNTKYGTGGNGFELLTNFHGRNVDLFGTPLSGDAADPTKTTPVYVVSTGGVIDNTSGVENIAGYYATEWVVYGSSNGTDYNRITDGKANGKSSIPPEVLVLNDDDATSFNTTTYPSADANHAVTDWKDLYTALEAYRGKPVMISYEAADAQQGQGMYYTGTGGATRNDGRWLYSKNGESITSNIKIQYSNDNGTTYIDLDTANPGVEGISAYFTNTDVYGTQTYATTIDPDKTFDFEAKTTNGSYKFVGWYLDDTNQTLITDDNAGSTERSGSYTFVAKFMLVTEGQLILSHSVDTGTVDNVDYDGAGTVSIAAVVKDGDGATVKTFAPTTSDITLDNKIIKSDNIAYTVDVTLTATRGNNSALGTTILATPDGQDSNFFDYGDFTVSADGKTRTYSFTFSVGDLYSGTTQTYMNLIYHSYFKNYVFKYTVNYEFTGRDGGKKIYNRAGTLTAPQAEAYVYKDTVTSGGSQIDMRFLRKEFFESLAPYESNFQQSLTWNFTNKQFTDGTNYVYNCNAHFEAIQADSNEKVNVTFVLPYAHTNGVATMNNGVGTAAISTNYALINDGENDNRVSFGTIPTLTGGRTNDIYTEEEKSHWIAAPAKLNDGTIFSHWSIKTTDSDVEVAKCYFPGFNFLAYDNYEIEAVYELTASSISASGINTSVTYLSTTRNQWNALNSSQEAVPDVSKVDTTNAADVLFNDFVLSYNYNGADIYLNGSDASAIEELGVVVERVKELDKNSDNSYDTRISSYTSLAENENNVDAAINTQVDQNGKATYKDGSLQYYKQTIGKNQLDNKNRIQFYEAFFNAAGWNSTNQKPQTGYTYKKYVYRAYSYMKLSNGNIVKSVNPAYFTMYDVATASYSSN